MSELKPKKLTKQQVERWKKDDKIIARNPHRIIPYEYLKTVGNPNSVKETFLALLDGGKYFAINCETKKQNDYICDLVSEYSGDSKPERMIGRGLILHFLYADDKIPEDREIDSYFGMFEVPTNEKIKQFLRQLDKPIDFKEVKQFTIERALLGFDGDRLKASEALGISLEMLNNQLKHYGYE